MGEVVRKDAAAATILKDTQTTHTNAVAKGGDWQTHAEARIGPIINLATLVDGRLTAAQKAAAPVLAQLLALNIETDKFLGGIADRVWNDVGRPGQDPAMDIILPGGITYYADGSVEEQPDRMQLLAELLEAGIHPRLEPTKATGYATEVRQAATRLEALVDAARPLRARLALAERMQQAIAKAAAIALARLKSQWKSDGKTEAEIHTVIPDRPRSGGGGGGGGGDPTRTT